jgi:RNA polymerase sigma-70 factor (ECF subfamily)
MSSLPDRGSRTPTVSLVRAAPDSPLERSDEASDARLVEQARLGDDDAFGLLVVRYERKLLHVLNRLVRDEELARDLAQETFWKVYTRLDRFDTARRFGPWLFRVGVNLSLDLLRRNGPWFMSIDRPRDVRDGFPEMAASHAADLAEPDPRIHAEFSQEVHHVLERLPLDYRTVLVLRDLEGFSSAEVAAIVGRREATIRWKLAKARALFRQHWERRQLVPPLGRPTDRNEVRHGHGA